MKIRDIIKKLESEGWVLVRQKGSHKQYKNTNKPDLITAPDHGSNKEPSIGVLNDIKKKAGWK
jgi:predicted RNA binding protein YcfA (HicA-like mRNA interferase family)